MNKWWKIVGVALITYSFIAGMLIPLKPGISSIDLITLKTGSEGVVSFNGYNTNFASANTSTAWLKIGERVVKSIDFQAQSETEASCKFRIPNFLPSDKQQLMASLVVNNEVDGFIVLPSAVTLIHEGEYNPVGERLWEIDKLDGLVANEAITFPFRNILLESIRDLFYHVPLWFAMFFLFAASAYHAVQFLRKGKTESDLKSYAITQTGIIYGVLGLITGAIWAKHTWGQYWSFDVKQNMTAVFLMINFAYIVLRQSIDDQDRKARFAAVYNIFSFLSIIPLLFIIPRMYDSLHPGNGGNPGFGGEDLDNTMRMIFYPAIIGWIIFGFWVSQIYYRYLEVEKRMLESDD